MKNILKQCIFLLIVLTIIIVMCACANKSFQIKDLRLEERFQFSLPENGEVLYNSSVTIGFDFRDYVVISYNSEEEIETLPWKEMSDLEIYDFNNAVRKHNELLGTDQKEYIPEEFTPKYDAVRGIYLENSLKTLKTMMLFDKEMGNVYICTIKQ